MKKYLQKIECGKWIGEKHIGKKYFSRLASLLAVFLVLCTGCGYLPTKLTKVDTAMGTIIQQNLYGEGDLADEAEEILQCINNLEQNQLSWRLENAELYRLNQSAGSVDGMEVSEELMGILEQCMDVAEGSEGAFDPTIGQVVRLWNIDEWSVSEDGGAFVPPAEEQLAILLADCGYDKIKIVQNTDIEMEQFNSEQIGDEENRTRGEVEIQGNTIVLPAGMQLDLGAVGKGIALDSIAEILEQRTGISGAVISVGGSILTYGVKDDGSSWKVGIVDPFDTADYLGTLSLSGQWCISTSGDYERYVEVDGVRYHHILNPHTGEPADSGVRSVTILSKSGLYSDALSTACFVLGVEKGLELAEHFEAEALFVDTNGEIVMTEGMGSLFKRSSE